MVVSYFRMGDPEADFDRLDREQAMREAQLPVCDYCGEPIHERYYLINGDTICFECLDDQFGKDVDLD